MTRKILIPIFFFIITSNLFSQENEEGVHGISIRAGYAYSLKSPLGEQFNGIHFGLNIHEKQDTRLVGEGQINLNYLSDETNTWNINILTGYRLNFNNANHKKRYYLSSLIGLGLENGTAVNAENVNFRLGTSIGLYGQLQKVMIGISLENPSAIIFKLGYTLK